MISKLNFDTAKPMLIYQLKKRGENSQLTIDKWDTFNGWKKRGRSIRAGSKGYRVEMVVPFIKGYEGTKKITGFSYRQKVLFSEDQTS